MRSRILTLVSLLVWAEAARAQGQPPDAAPAAEPVEIVAAALTVPVLINGQGPFHFAIDSGATTSLIASEVAELLQLPRSDQVRIHAMGGTASLRTVRADSIEVAGNRHRAMKLAAVPRVNLEADGLLGINLLKNQRVTLDFFDKIVRIEPSTAAEAVPEEAEQEVSEIVITARKRHGQLVMVDADANGQRVWVIIDSGSGPSVGNLKLMQLLVRRAPGIAIKPISLMDVIGRQTDARYTFVDRLRIGGIAIGNIPIAFADAHPFRHFDLSKRPALLLGMETLEIFNQVTIDFRSKKVTFEIAKEKLGPPLK